MSDATQDRQLRDSLVREAHSIPVPVLNSPALIWHLALWPKAKKPDIIGQEGVGLDPQDARSEGEYAERYKTWINSINHTIRVLEGNIDTKILLQVDNSGFPSLSKSFYEFSILWREIIIDITANVFFDFVTFSFFIDVRKNEERIEQSSRRLDEKDTASVILKFVAAIQSEANKRRAETKKGNIPEVIRELVAPEHLSASTPKAEPLTAAHEELPLFRDLWENHFVRDMSNKLAASASLFPGEAFAKFFGIVLPFGDERVSQVFDEEGHDDQNSRLAIQSYWPFIRRANDDPEDRHFIACSMLDKRALYITAMGANAGASETSLGNIAVNPVHYVVLVRPNADPYQTGRLVEHINSLGTMRLVALKEMPLLRRLGTLVRIFGHRLDDIAAKFTGVLREATEPVSDPEDYKRFLDLFEKAKSRKSDDFGDDSILRDMILKTHNPRLLQVALCCLEAELYSASAEFTGGVQFRVSRSRFYVSVFKERLAELKIGTIYPYQSYIAFVKRRLYVSFDYISDIGDRVSALRERLHGILESIQSKAMVDLTVNIQNWSGSIAAQTKSLNEILEAANEQKEQEQWQSHYLALIGVFAFLGQICFYLIWTGVLGTVVEYFFSINVSRPSEETAGAIAYSAAGFIVFISYFVILIRARWAHRKKQAGAQSARLSKSGQNI